MKALYIHRHGFWCGLCQSEWSMCTSEIPFPTSYTLPIKTTMRSGGERVRIHRTGFSLWKYIYSLILTICYVIAQNPTCQRSTQKIWILFFFKHQSLIFLKIYAHMHTRFYVVAIIDLYVYTMTTVCLHNIGWQPPAEKPSIEGGNHQTATK